MSTINNLINTENRHFICNKTILNNFLKSYYQFFKKNHFDKWNHRERYSEDVYQDLLESLFISISSKGFNFNNIPLITKGMKNKFKKEYNKLNCTTDKKIFIYVYNFLTSKNRYNGLIYKSDRGLNPIDLSLSEYISSPNLDHVFENASFIHELYTYSPIKQQILDFIELLMGNYKDYKRLLDSYSGVGKENIEKYKVSKQALQQKRNNDTKFLKNIIIENALFYLDQKNNKYKLLNKKNKHLSKNTNILRERVQKVVSEFIDNINSEHDTTFYEIK